jgi:hypothetical protein
MPAGSKCCGLRAAESLPGSNVLCCQVVSAAFFEQVLQTGQIESQNVLHWALMKLAYPGLMRGVRPF